MADPLAEKVMQPAVNPDHLSYCPTMDLVALATIDEQVHVNRLNGQKVFGVSNKRAPSGVKHIKWKPNGRDHSSKHPPILYNTITLGSAVLLKLSRSITCGCL